MTGVFNYDYRNQFIQKYHRSELFDSYSNVSSSGFLESNSVAVADYSWISNSSFDSVGSNAVFVFCFFWFFILILISFFNVGLASLLFLIEAGLFTPIAAMAAINILPFSTVLYFLNAITMEAVVGVIISLSYSRDWGHRDFTKYEILEGSFFCSNRVVFT